MSDLFCVDAMREWLDEFDKLLAAGMITRPDDCKDVYDWCQHKDRDGNHRCLVNDRKDCPLLRED